MTGPILLLSLSLKRARTLLVATGLLLAAFQVLLVLIASSIHPSKFEDLAALLPPFVRALLGPAVASVMSFGGIVCLGYFDLDRNPVFLIQPHSHGFKHGSAFRFQVEHGRLLAVDGFLSAKRHVEVRFEVLTRLTET